jgi:hypothetical protein
MLVQDLINKIRERSFLPNTTNFSDQKILDETNLCQSMMVLAAIIEANGEYFTEVIDVAPDPTGFVRMPSAAIASTARILTWVNSDGSESAPLRRRELADINTLQVNGYAVGQPLSFTLVPDGIMTYGIAATGKCRVRFSRLPSTLVIPVAGTNQWTLGTPTQVGGNWIASVTPASGLAGSLDLTDPLAPHRWLGQVPSASASTINLGAVGVADVLAARVAGANVNLIGQTTVPQYPDEWHSLLMYYSAAVMAGLRKDYGLKQDLLGDATSLRRTILNMATPRTKQNPKIISAWRGHSTSRRNW